MHRVLVSLLGKGQWKLTGVETYYRTAAYYRSSKDIPVDTPFVEEALLTLAEEPYDLSIVLGSSSAMWHILYRHCMEEESLTEQELEKNTLLANAIESGDRETVDRLLPEVESAWALYTDVSHRFRIIPSGINPIEDKESIFRLLKSLIPRESIVDLDITHGLRSQSYLVDRSILGLVQLHHCFAGQAFYGALELTDSLGRTPILSMGPLATDT